MIDTVPTTPKSQDDEQVELREKSVPDARGFRTRKNSSELPVGKAPVHQDSEDYNMEHPNRGTCLVFNHSMYDDQDPRENTSVDVERIQQTFGTLGFSVDVCDDYEFDDIKEKIKTLSMKNHEDNDCVCIIVLSHGNNKNKIWARDKKYPLNVLWEPFTANNCLTLAGKPKLFFIATCRGDRRDRGVLLKIMSPHKISETDGSGSSSYVIPTEADFFFGFSTPHGYCSWRSPEVGTWYIQSLCDVLDEYAATTHLADMLTITAKKVTMRVSFNDVDKNNHNMVQVPEKKNLLLRRVYFTPKQGAIVSQNISPQREIASPEQADSKQETSQQVTSRPKECKSNYCKLL